MPASETGEPSSIPEERQHIDTASVSAASDDSSRKRKRRNRRNGNKGALDKRRDSLSKTRDPRDDPPSEKESKEETRNGAQEVNRDTASASTSSDESRRRRRRRRRNGKKKKDADEKATVNGHKGAFDKRRNSLGKAARDPRDEPPVKKKGKKGTPNGIQEGRIRSPTPASESDGGLSRPSTYSTRLCATIWVTRANHHGSRSRNEGPPRGDRRAGEGTT